MRQAFLHLILSSLLILLLYPLLLTLWGAMKNELSWIYDPWTPTLPLKVENLSIAWHSIGHYVWNTVWVALVGTLGLLLQSSWAAFVFARLQFRGKEFLFMMVISLMMIPAILTLVPSYMIYSDVGLINSYWVLIIPQWVTGPIFGVFLLRSFFASTPEEIFEAARIDGCGDFKLYGLVSLPLLLPILATLAIMNVVHVWNDLIWPSITILDDNKMTIAFGLIKAFSTSNAVDMPATFAGYVLASVPMLLLFIVSSKYYVEGLTSSALKM